MVRPNQETVDLEEIAEAEVALAVTGVVASEVVEVSVGVTVAAMEEEVVTKWVEEVIAETTEETGLTNLEQTDTIPAL